MSTELSEFLATLHPRTLGRYTNVVLFIIIISKIIVFPTQCMALDRY